MSRNDTLLRLTQKETGCGLKIKRAAKAAREQEKLNRPAAGIEDNQRRRDDHGARIEFTPLAGYHAANHQRCETDHDAGHDVAGQHDEHRGNQPRHRINEVIEVDFRHVAQHQQANVHQRWRGRVGRHQIGERRKEQDQQERASTANGDGRQAGFTARRRTGRRFDIHRRRSRAHHAGEHAAQGVGSQRFAAVDDLPVFIQQVSLAGHRANGTGSIEYRGHDQRHHAWQHHRIQRADDIKAANQRIAFVIARQRRHGENPGEVDVRIENQPDN